NRMALATASSAPFFSASGGEAQPRIVRSAIHAASTENRRRDGFIGRAPLAGVRSLPGRDQPLLSCDAPARVQPPYRRLTSTLRGGFMSAYAARDPKPLSPFSDSVCRLCRLGGPLDSASRGRIPTARLFVCLWRHGDPRKQSFSRLQVL